MADIINFQAYVNAESEEKLRIKKVSMLSSKREYISGLLHSIENCIGVSLVTKHFGEADQIVGRESVIESGLLEAVVSSIRKYEEDIQNEIKELEGMNCIG